jgi:hypothetical protein
LKEQQYEKEEREKGDGRKEGCKEETDTRGGREIKDDDEEEKKIVWCSEKK